MQQKQWLDILSEEERSSEKNENAGEPTVVGDDFLAANPRILEDALIQALNGNSADLVSSLAALYRKQPNHNPKLITRADALLAKLKGRTSEAVKRYHSPFQPCHSITCFGGVAFCCTFPIVAYAGRYPASLPCGARTFLTLT